jgi:hypothetical protein
VFTAAAEAYDRYTGRYSGLLASPASIPSGRRSCASVDRTVFARAGSTTTVSAWAARGRV